MSPSSFRTSRNVIEQPRGAIVAHLLRPWSEPGSYVCTPQAYRWFLACVEVTRQSTKGSQLNIERALFVLGGVSWVQRDDKGKIKRDEKGQRIVDPWAEQGTVLRRIARAV
jgi:hypothetical protein